MCYMMTVTDILGWKFPPATKIDSAKLVLSCSNILNSTRSPLAWIWKVEPSIFFGCVLKTD